MHTNLHDISDAMQKLANDRKAPAAICDWASDRYTELADKSTVRVEDLLHMVEYAVAVLLDDPDRIREALDGISGYMRGRRPDIDMVDKVAMVAKHAAVMWRALGIDDRCAGLWEDEFLRALYDSEVTP